MRVQNLDINEVKGEEAKKYEPLTAGGTSHFEFKKYEEMHLIADIHN